MLSSQKLQMQYDAQGLIRSLQLEQGNEIPLGYCLDCRAQAEQSGQTLHLFSAQDKAELLQQPFSTAIRMSWGYIVRLPLQGGSYWSSQYSGSAADLAQIQQELQQKTGLTDWQLDSSCSKRKLSPGKAIICVLVKRRLVWTALCTTA